MVASNEYIQSIIETYRAAARCNLSTRGREGGVVSITPDLADDVLIVGNLQGSRRNFVKVKKIADLEHYPRRQLILQGICHGGPTYPNGGCMSHTLLEDVAKLKTLFPHRVHLLLGIHEFSELLDFSSLKGTKKLSHLYQLGMQEMYGHSLDRVKSAQGEFLKTCPLLIRIADYVVCCQAVPENVPWEGFDASLLERRLDSQDFWENSPVRKWLWGRDDRLENIRAFAQRIAAKVLIQGCDTCEQGISAPNDLQIFLDATGERAGFLLLPTQGDWTHDLLLKKAELIY